LWDSWKQEQRGLTADGAEAAIEWADVVILATPSMTDDESIKTFASTLEPLVRGIFTAVRINHVC
jgi:predicted dinucleotide-binding enzyme